MWDWEKRVVAIQSGWGQGRGLIRSSWKVRLGDKDKKNSPFLSQLGQNQTKARSSGERIRGAGHPLTGQVRSESVFKSYEIVPKKEVVHGVYIPIHRAGVYLNRRRHLSPPLTSLYLALSTVIGACAQPFRASSLGQHHAWGHYLTPNPTSMSEHTKPLIGSIFEWGTPFFHCSFPAQIKQGIPGGIALIKESLWTLN